RVDGQRARPRLRLRRGVEVPEGAGAATQHQGGRVLLPARERRVHQHADARADRHEGRSGRRSRARGVVRPARPAESRKTRASRVVSHCDVDVLRRGPVLVTGATGFLGRSLVRRLVRAGVPVRALVRSPAKASRLVRCGVEVVVGDVADGDTVAPAVEGVTVVFHLAGKLYAPWEPEESYRRTHVEGTERLVERAQRERGLERFVHCSTTGVLGTTGDEPADERAPLQPTNVYEATKAAAELVVRRACDEGL